MHGSHACRISVNQDEHKLVPLGRYQQLLLELQGYLQGMALDSALDDAESRNLRQWLIRNDPLLDKPPFKDLKEQVYRILEDGHLDTEEWENISWLCASLTAEDGPGRLRIAADMRRLQGILRGVLSDGRITLDEVQGLESWLADHGHMAGYWPYDEIVRLVKEVLQDQQVDESERDVLQAYFNDFTLIRPDTELKGTTSRVPSMLSGVLAENPRIQVRGHRFAFTGLSSRGSRSHIIDAIERQGGVYQKAVDERLDVLVVGGGMVEHWAFSCFGRKVEEAVRIRQSGVPLVLVSEKDFWEQVEG